MKEIDKTLSLDFDDDNELDVEYYQLPKGLQAAWDALHDRELAKSLNPTIANDIATVGDKSPGPGLGINYVIRTPNKKMAKRKQKDKNEEDPTNVKQALKAPPIEDRNPLKTTKETYEGYRGISIPNPIRVQSPTTERGSSDVERTREHVDGEVKRRQGTRNVIPIEKS